MKITAQIESTNKYYKKLLNFVNYGKKIKLYLIMHIIRKKILKNFDPEIKVKIGERFLFINLAHKLPIYYYKYSNYDRALPRISKKLKEIDKQLCVIDIGANIGDTIFFITNVAKGSFLCVEGNKNFLPILEKNIKHAANINHIKIEQCYCGDDTNNEFSITQNNGTAKIIKENKSNTNGKSATKIMIKKLDDIINDHMEFAHSNLLKIDTDGYEIEVLKSGVNFIKTTRPLIYFEFTPSLYLNNKQNPDDIWQILKTHGYEKALFYNNFGEALGLIDIRDKDKINQMVDKIDEKNIYYFDILTCHNSDDKYFEILKSELNIFGK